MANEAKEKTKKTQKDYDKEYEKKSRAEAAKIEMVSKLAKRQKMGKYYPKNTDGTKGTDTQAALNTFDVQKDVDKNNPKLKIDLISDQFLSKREGSFKSGGRVNLKGGGCAIRGIKKNAYGKNS